MKSHGLLYLFTLFTIMPPLLLYKFVLLLWQDLPVAHHVCRAWIIILLSSLQTFLFRRNTWPCMFQINNSIWGPSAGQSIVGTGSPRLSPAKSARQMYLSKDICWLSPCLPARPRFPFGISISLLYAQPWSWERALSSLVLGVNWSQ